MGWWSFDFKKGVIHIAIILATSVTYATNGMQTTFTIPFDYLRPAFVYATLDGVNLDSTEYEVSNRTVTFKTAPATGKTLRIYRNTPTQRLVSWADASILKAKDMTVYEVQQLHLIEEGQDWYKTKSMSLDEDVLKWEARHYPIQNVADPIQAQDAATVHYLKNTFMQNVVDPAINKYFGQSNVSIYAQRAREYMQEAGEHADTAKKWADVAKSYGLTCVRWQIGTVRDRDASKPNYGLNNIDLIISVPDVIKLNITGNSKV